MRFPCPPNIELFCRKVEANAGWEDAVSKGDLHRKVFPMKEFRKEVLTEFVVEKGHQCHCGQIEGKIFL